jgi:hypothetical protein
MHGTYNVKFSHSTCSRC